MPEAKRLLTIGHSTQLIAEFISLLRQYEVHTLVDVRSAPYSKFAPQFSRDPLETKLRREGITYVFKGDALGGRPKPSEFYGPDDHVLYYRVAEAPWFLNGLRTLEDLVADGITAVMCSEEDPAGCHRHLLLARVLVEGGMDVEHLRKDGSNEPYGFMPDVVRRNLQEPLFKEQDVSWRSIRSVPRNAAPRTSSVL